MGNLFLHSLRPEALGAREGAKTQKKKSRNSFHLILLGVFAPSRDPTKASLYQGHGADLLTSQPDFQLLTKKILSNCERRVSSKVEAAPRRFSKHKVEAASRRFPHHRANNPSNHWRLGQLATLANEPSPAPDRPGRYSAESGAHGRQCCLL